MGCFPVYTIVIPLVCCIVYGAWPSPAAILPAFVTLLMMLGVQAVLEAALYVPILGSSSYLTFITGNIMNLKIPCALNAQESTDFMKTLSGGWIFRQMQLRISQIYWR